eukprot:gnl/TRDRNA2_/TRDRNA2_121755_c0_seq1.p1 gnl/TRDRNA2_/TRDRNA2_121755_c0~~gnl/TRDRNA2_/TRDRNA2_121755_c0_seq1.p1  ORF type:complete len:116 (+),score=19.95 gnl/TRDRNA2_/TRDRNA2_121755_c0_seq1:1-348(+)
MSYTHELASKGGQVLAEAWGTEKLVEDDMIGAMVNVRLPDAALACCGLEGLTAKVFSSYNTWVPSVKWAGKCYMRVSAQVYNELSDFEMLAHAVLQTLKIGCNAGERTDQTALSV